MKDVSVSAGLGETYLRDVLVRGREPGVERMRALERELGFSRQDAIPIEDTRSVVVRGVVQAGYWTESFEWPEEDWYTVPLYAGQGAPQTLRGAEIRGNSMNRWRPEGTVVVFTDHVELGEELKVGKRYVVERTNAAGEHECTVKKLWQDEAGMLWLLPESDDPRFQTPIELNGNEGDTIRILGRVTHTIVRED